MTVTEDMPLASNDIDVQLLESAKSGDLETVKVCITSFLSHCNIVLFCFFFNFSALDIMVGIKFDVHLRLLK